MRLVFLVIFVFVLGTKLTNAAVILGQPDAEKLQPVCGYESCTKSDPEKVNIHLVAHTHDDVGWLKTVDQYYFGERMDIHQASVKNIIDSVVDALVKDSNRRFIYVETAFLWKWLVLQNEERREIMKDLINEGRLEIIGGGWSMNDEATTHYQSMIDQYTWGFRRLNDTFGKCARPKIGWQIDPFGHSREQASMFAQLGFDGLLFGRLDHQDKSKRLNDQTTEFIWEGSPNLGSSANIFTSVLYNLYQAPRGFCFDPTCPGTEKIEDDPDDPEYNIERKVKNFLKFVDKQSKSYRTNNLIMTMGGDFTYQEAEYFYENLDKLIHGINKMNGTKYQAFYSTPSCYVKALHEHNLTWKTKDDDFFPYASGKHEFWTGYFTSRPTLKYFERLGNNFLQIAKQMSVLTNASDTVELELFREAMGMMQHHDAVTGTEKQHVADDYARILYHSFSNGGHLAANALRKLATKEAPKQQAEFHTCLLLNISSCDYTSDNSKFVVTMYNPTSQPLDTYVRLPVQGSKYAVKDFNGSEVVTQIVPIPERVQQIPGRISNATRELVFRASNIAPFAYQSFYVDLQLSNDDMQLNQMDNQLIQIGKKNYNISVNEQDNILVQLLPFGIEYEQSLQYYESAEGSFSSNYRSSGAYIFKPKSNTTKKFSNTTSFQVFKGPLVEEIHQVINNWTSQVIRIYNDENHVEFEWLIGPIPVDDFVGKEVIAMYSSNLKNKDEFYTDSNGREMLKRKLNYRPTWKLQLNESIAGNYYPVTAKISIEDEDSGRRLSVLNDRAQGGSSLREGEIELMIHRRLLRDDGYGVGEALNEYAYGEGLVVRGQHIVIGGSLQNSDELFLREKEQAVKLARRPWIFVSPTNYSLEEWNEYYSMKGESMIGKLPRNIHILTLEPWRDDKVLLRLEHLFELNESPEYSVPAQVNLNDLFPNFHLQSVVETTLGANQHLEESTRLVWKAEKNEVPKVEGETLETSNHNLTISLKPMEIRTFLVKFSPDKKPNA